MVNVKRWEVVEHSKTLIKDRYQSEAALVTQTAQHGLVGGKKKHKNHVEPNYIFDFALIYVECKIYT